MRIAVFTDNFYPELGGIQDSILTNVRELGARGHEIMVFAPVAAIRDYRRANLSVAEPDLGPNVTIRRLFSIPMPSSSQQSRVVIPTGRCWRDIVAFHPDIVHTHTFLGVGLEGLWAARRLGVPLVGTNHWAVGAFDMYAPLVRNAFRRASSRAVVYYYQHCDWVTGPSRFTIEDMQVNGLNRPCLVISNPIDTDAFHTVSEAKRQKLKARLNLGAASIVYAGRFGREKRIEVVIRAVAALKETLPAVTLVLAGHGSYLERLKALTHELGIYRQVRFVGTLGHAALADLFSAADLFAIASTSETQSMVTLQAMACGLPVVGARCGGLVEYIPATVGLLADPECPGDFSHKLVQILTSQMLRKKMRQQAQKFVRAFSVSSIADVWEDVYTRLVYDTSPDSQLLKPTLQVT